MIENLQDKIYQVKNNQAKGAKLGASLNKKSRVKNALKLFKLLRP